MVDQEKAQPFGGETPQPSGLAIHAPAGLVGVEHRRVQRFLVNGLVPRQENLRQPAPHVQQPARRDLEKQVEIEDLHDLRKRVAQHIVQPRAEDQHPVAQGRARQGRRHNRLDFLLASRTPVAVNGMLGDFRTDAFGYVFGVARAGLRAAVQRPAAVGTHLGAVCFTPVDTFGRHAPAAGVAHLASRLFLAAHRRLGFPVNWLHARRGGGRLVGSERRLGLLLRQQLGLRQQGKHHGIFAQCVDRSGLLLREQRSQWNATYCRRHGVLAQNHNIL